MSDVIDELAIEISANDQFTAVAKPLLSLLERLEQSVHRNSTALEVLGENTQALADDTQQLNNELEKNEKQTKKNTKELSEQEKQTKKNEKVAKNLFAAVTGFSKALGALSAMIMAGVGLERLAMESANANRELDNTSKNLGMTSQSLASWRGVAEMSGGSAQGLTGYLTNLSGSLTKLTMQGDMSVAPFFNALGIDLLSTSGKARKLEDIMFDLADRFSTMDRAQAFSLAQQMGIDEGTFNVLSQGRQALEEHLQKVSRIYKSNQQDLETSRKLTAATNYLNQQFDGLKLMIANAVAPVLLKIAEITSNFFDFLQRNEDLVKGVFFGIAGAITAVLIPTLWAGATAAAAFIAPFLPAILIVAGLALAFGLLYDDYKKFVEGGISLFNWGNFIKWFEKANLSVDNLKNAFARLVTGYESWDEAVNAGKAWLKSKGFIDENGVSLDSLANGFKNLVTDIKNAVIPALKRVWEIIEAVLDGEFSKAIELSVSAAGDTWEFVKEETKDTVIGDVIEGVEKNIDTVNKFLTDETYKIGDAVSDMANNAIDTMSKAGYRVVIKGAEVIDTAFGIDPDKDDFSLTQTIKKGEFADSQKGFSKGNPTDYSKEKSLSEKKKFEGFGSEIDSYIKEGSQRFGVDEKTLRGFVKMEDGWYGKMSGTGAIGTGQFTLDTWNDLAKTKEGQEIGMTLITKDNFRKDNDPRWNKRVNTLATALLAKKNGDLLKKQGIEATGENLYMAHNIGVGGFTRAMRGNATTGDIDAMRKNGMKQGMTPQEFVQYQKGRFNNHYAQANNVSPKIDMNRPIGGYAVASALQANQHHLSSMQKLAQPQSISNNRKTEVVFNGGININSSANTLSGTAGDFVKGVNNHGASAFQFVNGVS